MKKGVMMQCFEWNLPNDGKHWERLRTNVKHLKDIGITAVWIPPAYKADEQQDEGYAVYDLFDLGEFYQKNTLRTKYGTKKELKKMISELHRYNISVYLDAVMNHKSWGDFTEKIMVEEVDPTDRNLAITKPFKIQAWTGYNFPGRKEKYSDFMWHWYHFSGTDYDDATKKSGVFRIIGVDKQWSEDVDDENGNYDFLLGNDLDLNHPEVIRELNKWGTWVSKELNLDGMRLDAVKHMSTRFMNQFLAHVRSCRKQEFYAVGEYWSVDLNKLDNYLQDMNMSTDLFDVPLHYNFFEASQKGKDYDLRKIFENTLVGLHPENAVTFVDNHDSQTGSSLESNVSDWFKPMAYSLILLIDKGYPCVFYGDYYGVDGNKSPHRLIIEMLLNARRQYAYGGQTDYFDDPNICGFVRSGDLEHSGLALLVSNDDNGSKPMYVGTEHAGEIWYEFTGSVTEKITIDDKGYGCFFVKGKNLAVWVKE